MSDSTPKKYCPYCGHELPPGQIWYCPYCGSSLKDYFERQVPNSVSQQPKVNNNKRPLGVTIISILEILFGFLFAFIGISLIIIRVIINPSMLQQLNSQMLSYYGVTFTYNEIEAYSMYMGLVSFILAVILLISGYGLVKMKNWGRIISMIVAISASIISFIDILIVPSAYFILILLISLIEFIYLERSRNFFKRADELKS
ncbi:MAG: zinc ribbon domain-containing protein [Thermoprotei archaeon]